MRSFLLLLAFFSSLSLHAQQILPENWGPVAQGNTVLDRLVKVTAPEVKGAHDAEFVMVGDYAYIVAEVNDLKAGESGNWTFIYSAMSIVNLKTMVVEKIIPFARSEQQFANVSLPEGQCWIPRIIQKDKKTLRIYFVNERSGDNPHSQVWYIDYDLRSSSFSKKIHKVKIKTAAGKLNFTTENFYRDAKSHGFNKEPVGYGAYLFDSFKEFDGKTYITLNNFPGKQNALAVANKKLDTFEVLGHFNEPQSANLSESSVNRLPDGTWMAICRRDEEIGITTSAIAKTAMTGPSVNQFLPFQMGQVQSLHLIISMGSII